MARFRLVGGPCDGQRSQDFTVTPFIGFQILCQTHQYEFRGDSQFHDIGVTPVLRDQPLAPSAHNAWGDLRHSVNRKLPTAIARSQAYRRAMRRKLHQRRRIG